MSLIRKPANARWPNGIIPFAFDSKTIPGGDPVVNTITQAMQAWQNVAPVTFVPRNNEADFLAFRRDPSAPRCNSAVGRKGGKQEILCAGAPTAASLAHEIGHAIGLLHEHQRVDRDAMVAVSQHALNIEPQNYTRLDEELMNGPYDFGSLLHYGTVPGLLTKISPDPTVPGNALAPDAGDAEGVKFMYGIVPDRTPVAALSRKPDHVELWVVDEFGNVRGAWYDNGWQTWYLLFDPNRNFPQRANLACLTRHDGHMEVWGVGSDGVLHGIWWDGTWQPWYSLTGTPVVTPLPPGTPALPPGAPLAALRRHEDHMEVWVVGNDGRIHGIHFDGSWDNHWYTLDGRVFPPGARLAALSRNENHMELWAIGVDDKLHGIFFDGSWDNHWYTLEGAPNRLVAGGGVAAVTRGSDHMEVFTIGREERLLGVWFDGSWDKHWHTLLGPACPPGAPLAALSRFDGHEEVWCVSKDSRLECVWWDGTWENHWSRPTQVGMFPGTPPTALARTSDHMEVFTVAPDDPFVFRRGVQSVFWNGSWEPMFRIT